MQYRVNYTFGATLIVEADSKAEARDKVEEMPTDELFSHARDGFEVQDVEGDDDESEDWEEDDE